MSTSTFPIPNIVISSSGPQLVNPKHNKRTDDYMRFVTSNSGQYLASISNKRQLTLFDTENPAIFNDWSEQNVFYLAFSETQQQFAILTRTPSVKIYEIKTQQSVTASKSINLVQEVKSEDPNTFYGWITWTLDNKYIIYAKNQKIFGMKIGAFQEFSLSDTYQDVYECNSMYLLIDRETQQLVSMSRTGTVCTYQILFPTLELISNNPDSKPDNPKLKVLHSSSLSPDPSPLIMADLNQGPGYLIASTALVTENKKSYYKSFIMNKSDTSFFWTIQLQPELIAPPLMIQADNVGQFVLAFLKGQKSLYVFDLRDFSNGLTQNSNNSTNTNELKPRQKIQLSYLLHSLNYNKFSNKLFLGTTTFNNQDKIIQVDFNFNCSQIANSSLTPYRQSCTQECQILSSKSYFSFDGGQCKSQNTILMDLKAKCEGVYEWNNIDEKCELMCDWLDNSLSKVAFGLQNDQKCYCEQNYVWSAVNVCCDPVNKNTVTPDTTNVVGNETKTDTNDVKINSNDTKAETIKNDTVVTPPQPPKNNEPKLFPSIPEPVPTPIVTPKNPIQTITKNNSLPSNPVLPTPIPTNNKATPTLPSQNIPTNEQTQKHGNSAVIIVLTILTVLLFIGLIVVIYLYKKKKLCFKLPLDLQGNELKDYQIKSSQGNPSDKNSQPSTDKRNKSIPSHKSSSLESSRNKNTKKLQKSPSEKVQEIPQTQKQVKEFDINEPIDQFIIEQIISDSIQGQDNNEYKADSQRKFY